MWFLGVSGAGKSEEYVVIYFKPERRGIWNSIFTSLKRIFKVIYTPFSAFDEIAEKPDKIGPILVIALALLLQYLSLIVVLNKVYVLVGQETPLENYTVTPSDNLIRVTYANPTDAPVKYRYLDISQSVIVLQITLSGAGLLVGWATLYLTNYLISRLLGSAVTEGFSSVGYVLCARLPGAIVDLVIKGYTIALSPALEIVVPSKIQIWEYNRYAQEAIAIWINYMPLSLNQFITAIYIFVILWGLVLNIAFSLSLPKLGGLKGFISGTLSYVAYVLLSTFIFPFL